MEISLYHPQHGYYARDQRQIGRAGDFFTSVSTGPLFGRLLATRFLTWWETSGRPSRWRILEVGAHDGTLAADVLAAARDLDPAACAGLEYILLDPAKTLGAEIRRYLTDFPAIVRTLPFDSLASLPPLPGIVFGNELIDALPCEIWQRGDADWRELGVGLTENPDAPFAWQELPQAPTGESLALLRAIEASQPHGGSAFRPGYRAEIRPSLAEFLAALAVPFAGGLMIWIDYGFVRADLYHPDRREGTLRTFSKHLAGDDPLATPGMADLTAHVDFSALASAAHQIGAVARDFRSQGSWLTGLARGWLLASEQVGIPPTPAEMRAFQTLTHPAQLGSRFLVLECELGAPASATIDAALAARLDLPTQPPRPSVGSST